MSKLTDFELAIAEYMWPLSDVDELMELMEDEKYRNLAQREARTILSLAKKELLKDAVKGEVVKDIHCALIAKGEKAISYNDLARKAINMADALIGELKRE